MTPLAFRSYTEGGGTGMAAKILKYAALPAAVAVGFSSFRIYSINEKINEELISPRELSIYSPDGLEVRFVEEQPGVVQTGLGAVRVGLQPYVRAVQNTFTSIKVGVISVYHAGQDSYHFLRDPPPGFLPRVGVIGVSGLGGLILARKGSRLKKIFVPLGLATAGAAVCYPTQTVGVLKITGKKVYTVSSSVASMFKSKPMEDVTMPVVSVESAAAVTSSDTEALSSESEPASAVPHQDVTPVTQVVPSVDLAPVTDLLEDSVEPPSVVDVVSGNAAPLSESPPAPAVETAPEPVLDAQSIPVPKPAPSAEMEITPVVESDPEIVLEAAPTASELDAPAPAVVIEEATPSSTPTVEQTTPPEAANLTPADEEAASVAPPPAEEAPPSSEPSVDEPATVKSGFVPDPSLLDHGQSNPEDADMYSTRS
ncbi:MICOS complex subunit MIC27-like [Carassius carassius]|uniref:MICOS complex subunit MIC27-like n=1 Tax=Carassius carassius TaxID=217509 RepID=UPI002868780E|nr:MICOS complex subunit MIC27-like [Carassius carassius]